MYKRRQLESSIENSCREYAHDKGWTSRKMNGLGFRSWPDRLFIPARKYGARPFWVEFKRPGEEPTPDQWRQIRELRARGEEVLVLDSRAEFIEVFNARNIRTKRTGKVEA